MNKTTLLYESFVASYITMFQGDSLIYMDQI